MEYKNEGMKWLSFFFNSLSFLYSSYFLHVFLQKSTHPKIKNKNKLATHPNTIPKVAGSIVPLTSPA
jgi:hypothetical protein